MTDLPYPILGSTTVGYTCHVSSDDLLPTWLPTDRLPIGQLRAAYRARHRPPAEAVDRPGTAPAPLGAV